MHPFLLAQSWRQQLDHDTRLTKARIAAREGISRARVTQVMNLLQLPAEIQANLLRPSASSIRAFELLSGDFLMVRQGFFGLACWPPNALALALVEILIGHRPDHLASARSIPSRTRARASSRAVPRIKSPSYSVCA